MTRALLSLGLALSLTLSQPAWGTNLDQWMTYEQKHVDRGVDPLKIIQPTIEGLKQQYRPDSASWFNLPSVWIPESELNVVQVANLIPPDLRSQFVRVRNGVTEFRLFVHPESQEFYQPLISKYPMVIEHQATATSSSRTLLVRSIADPSREYFVKVSLAVTLGGVKRTVLRSETARAVGTTAYLHSMRGELSPRFDLQDEPLGIVPKGWVDGGQLIRTIYPTVMNNEITPVPLFSLYASNPKGVLLDSLARKAGVSRAEFTEKFINKPFAEGWADWAINGSVIMEPHAQNVLLELGHDGKPNGKLLLRDLGGFNIDLKSPLFPKKRLSDLQFIESVKSDYWQDRVKDLHNYSLKTYYEGGFLYNVENYLSKTESDYIHGSVSQNFWSEAARAVRQVSGYDGFTEAQLKDETYEVLQKAREFKATRLSAAACFKRALGALALPLLK